MMQTTNNSIEDTGTDVQIGAAVNTEVCHYYFGQSERRQRDPEQREL